MKEKIVYCERCKAPCKAAELRDSKAKMLRHSEEPKGLCVNCAVHDWLRNTYPPNILLAQSGPGVLRFPHIQEHFAEIMRIGFADAKPDEIDWQRIVDNWDLPFPSKIKPTAANPCDQQELDAIKAGTHPGLGGRPAVCGPRPARKSLKELNELDPGLGDELGKCLRSE